jgi:hypothetical protein
VSLAKSDQIAEMGNCIMPMIIGHITYGSPCQKAIHYTSFIYSLNRAVPARRENNQSRNPYGIYIDEEGIIPPYELYLSPDIDGFAAT